MIDKEYLSRIGDLRAKFNGLLKHPGTGFQIARLLNNDCDLLLDLFDKFLSHKVTDDFRRSLPLRDLYSKIGDSAMTTLALARRALDSAIALSPGTYQLYITRSQLFATYARCLLDARVCAGQKEWVSASRTVFDSDTYVDVKKALNNIVDDFRFACALGFHEFEILDTVKDAGGATNLDRLYLGVLRVSPKHYGQIAALKTAGRPTWKSSPQYVMDSKK